MHLIFSIVAALFIYRFIDKVVDGLFKLFAKDTVPVSRWIDGELIQFENFKSWEKYKASRDGIKPVTIHKP